MNIRYSLKYKSWKRCWRWSEHWIGVFYAVIIFKMFSLVLWHCWFGERNSVQLIERHDQTVFFCKVRVTHKKVFWTKDKKTYYIKYIKKIHLHKWPVLNNTKLEVIKKRSEFKWLWKHEKSWNACQKRTVLGVPWMWWYRLSTQVHPKNGRSSSLGMDVTWFAVCAKKHMVQKLNRRYDDEIDV